MLRIRLRFRLHLMMCSAKTSKISGSWLCGFCRGEKLGHLSADVIGTLADARGISFSCHDGDLEELHTFILRWNEGLHKKASKVGVGEGWRQMNLMADCVEGGQPLREAPSLSLPRQTRIPRGHFAVRTENHSSAVSLRDTFLRRFSIL